MRDWIKGMVIACAMAAAFVAFMAFDARSQGAPTCITVEAAVDLFAKQEGFAGARRLSAAEVAKVKAHVSKSTGQDIPYNAIVIFYFGKIAYVAIGEEAGKVCEVFALDADEVRRFLTEALGPIAGI